MDAVIITALCRHCTLSHAQEVEAFFAAHPVPSSQRKIAQTLEAIRNSGAFLGRLQSSPLALPTTWS